MVFQFELNQHLFSKLSPLFVFSISIVKQINQSFELWNMPAFEMSSYHKLKISYIIRLVIIKHAQIREFNDTLSAIWWYKTLMKMHFWVLINWLYHIHIELRSSCCGFEVHICHFQRCLYDELYNTFKSNVVDYTSLHNNSFSWFLIPQSIFNISFP